MSIENRLAKLEAQNRLLRTVVVGAFALAVLPWLLGSDDAAEDAVRAKQFILVDDSGNPRGEWSYQTKTGTAELRLQVGRFLQRSAWLPGQTRHQHRSSTGR